MAIFDSFSWKILKIFIISYSNKIKTFLFSFIFNKILYYKIGLLPLTVSMYISSFLLSTSL
jgi:hypothetical protein